MQHDIHVRQIEKRIEIYPTEWTDIYKIAVLNYIENTSGRSQYQDGCH